MSYTSFMYFKRVIWLRKGCFDSSWSLLLWVGFGLNSLHLIHILHISKRAVLPLLSHKIILPLSLKSYLILKMHGWYVFGIKTRDENFQEFNTLSKRYFSVVLAAVFIYACDILKTSSFLFVHMWFEEREREERKKKKGHYFYVCSFKMLMT